MTAKAANTVVPTFGYGVVREVRADQTESGLHLPTSDDNYTRRYLVAASEKYAIGDIEIEFEAMPGDEVYLTPGCQGVKFPAGMPDDHFMVRLCDVCGWSRGGGEAN